MSADVLARQRAPDPTLRIIPAAGLKLTTVPGADYARYDRLRPSHAAENGRAAP